MFLETAVKLQLGAVLIFYFSAPVRGGRGGVFHRTVFHGDLPHVFQKESRCIMRKTIAE